MLPPIHLLDFVVRIETVRVGAIVHLVAGRIIRVGIQVVVGVTECLGSDSCGGQARWSLR